MFSLFSSNKKYNSISSEEAKKRLEADKNVLLIDVRTPEEYHSVRIPKSVNVPLDSLHSKIEKLVTEKDKEMIIYCHSGARASTACNELSKMGYTNISNLGGIMSWPYETIGGR